MAQKSSTTGPNRRRKSRAAQQKKDTGLPPIPQRRGFVREPSGNSWLAILIHAPANALARSLGKFKGVDRVEACTLSTLPKKPRGEFFFLVQLVGHAWTYVVGNEYFDVTLGADITSRIGKEVIITGDETHSEEFFERWIKKSLVQRIGSETDDADIDGLLRDNDAYAPVMFCSESRDLLTLESFPPDVLSATSVEAMYFVAKIPTLDQKRRGEANAATKDLFTAIAQGSLAGVQKAISLGANVNLLPLACRETPVGAALESACATGDTAILEALVAAGAEPNDGGEHPSIPTAAQCVFANELNVMKVILTLAQCGADVDARGNFGMTALEWAGGKGMLPAVKLLIKLGADANQRTADIAKWITNPKGNSLSKVRLLGRLVSIAKEEDNDLGVRDCIAFLRRIKAGKIQAHEIENFDDLVNQGSDNMAELRKSAKEYKSRKLPKRKQRN